MEDLRSLADLLDLQAVDLEIDRLMDRRGNLLELEAYRASDELLTAQSGLHEEAERRLREADLDLDKTNGELELATAKTAQEENRLYAGGLSARDADYLRREVEMLRERVRKMEDRVLELMEEREEAEQAEGRLAAEVEATGVEKTRLEGAISESWAEIDAEIAIKEEKKGAVVPHVAPDLLELYEELRTSREGAVVGELKDGVCTACHLKLSAAEETQARRDDPPRCIHCRAILVP